MSCHAFIIRAQWARLENDDMSTHDADKTNSNPSDRRTMTRDPNATGRPLVESGKVDSKGNPISVAGSVAATCNIDGKWYVCNIRGELTFGDKAYSTESDAVEAAQKLNAKHGAASV